jgi:hypothetical protein
MQLQKPILTMHFAFGDAPGKMWPVEVDKNSEVNSKFSSEKVFVRKTYFKESAETVLSISALTSSLY